MTGSPLASAPWLGLLGIGLVALLLAVAIVTVGKSVVSARRDAGRERVRPGVREGLLERLTEPDPEWAAWVDELGRTERAVLETELEAYLHELQGPDRRALQALGHALDIDERVRWQLATGTRYERRRALEWTALLDVEVSLADLQRIAERDPQTRDAAARVLAERDGSDSRPAGTELLLGDRRTSLSVLGLDTLYQFHKHDPALLFEAAASSYGEWSESLLIQVLRVIREAGPASTDAELGWIGFLFASDSPRVRAAAARALEDYGWHDGVRATIDLDQVRTDSAPQVRAAVYGMLGAWEDRASRRALLQSLQRESDPRAAVAGIEALENAGAVLNQDLSPASVAARDWLQEATTSAPAHTTSHSQ